MRRILKYLACTVAALVAVTLMGPVAAAQEPLESVDWAGVFSPGGKVLNLRGGVDAVFLRDEISDGVGIDSSMLVGGDSRLLDNGVVAPAHDLGNGYAWVKRVAGGNRQLYAGVERFESGADTFVEFEFNQGIVEIRDGAPWPIYGERQAGDLIVRVDFAAGVLAGATVLQWDGTIYQVVASAGPEGGSGADFFVCVGAPPVEPVVAEVLDTADELTQGAAPSSFVEIGVNVAAMLGSNPNFTSIQVRTPEDIILGSFRQIGLWAHRRASGGER